MATEISQEQNGKLFVSKMVRQVETGWNGGCQGLGVVGSCYSMGVKFQLWKMNKF